MPVTGNAMAMLLWEQWYTLCYFGDVDSGPVQLFRYEDELLTLSTANSNDPPILKDVIKQCLIINCFKEPPAVKFVDNKIKGQQKDQSIFLLLFSSAPLLLRTELQGAVVEIPFKKWGNPSSPSILINCCLWHWCKQIWLDVSNMPSKAVGISLVMRYIHHFMLSTRPSTKKVLLHYLATSRAL